MSDLASESCEACRADAPKVDPGEAKALLKSIPKWDIREEDSIPKLVRAYEFDDFVSALAFTNKVGEMAESQGHHPDLLTSWGKVEVTWWSHKLKGLHRNDFVCAARTDQLYS